MTINKQLILILSCSALSSATLLAQVPAMLNYQGRVSVNGTNFTGDGLFKFALVSGGRNENRQAIGIAQRSGKFIWGVEITDGGSGYSQPPAVRFIGGGGGGAEAVATVSNGAVTWIEVYNPGNNYTSDPAVEIDPPQENLLYDTFWSNDGTSANGYEPSGALAIAVDKGLFSALIGGQGMLPVPDNAFTNESVYLRVWFSPGGTNAFEQLVPDQRIATVGYAMKSQNAANAENALNAVAAQSAEIASTVQDGAITTDKLAAGAITADKIQAGTVDSEALAAGTVAGWQVVGSAPVTAAPNTKYLMPEDGSGLLTLPANPPVGTTIEVSGQGTVLANAGQLINGQWLSTSTDFPTEQVLVSDDGRTIIAYNPMRAMVGTNNYPPRLRILTAGASTYEDHTVPTNSSGDTAPWSKLAMSGDATTLLGLFSGGENSNYGRLYKSTDNAQTWEPFSFPEALGGLETLENFACSSDASVIYASGRWTNQTNGNMTNLIVRSLNAGADWTQVSEFPEGYTHSAPNPLLVSADGKTLVTFNDLPPWGVTTLRSTNYGSNWVATGITNNITNAVPDQSYYPTYYESTMSGDGLKIAMRHTPSSTTMLGSLVSSNGGLTWAAHEAASPLSSTAIDWNRFRLLYSGSGRSLLAAGVYPGVVPEVFSVISSSDQGKSWGLIFHSETSHMSSTPPHFNTLACDTNATVIAAKRNLGYSASETSRYGLYLSKGDRLQLSQQGSRTELVYRGNNNWSVLTSKETTASFGGN